MFPAGLRSTALLAAGTLGCLIWEGQTLVWEAEMIESHGT